MTINNFLKNKETITLLEARNAVTKEALGRNTIDSINKFETHYVQTLKDYYSDPRLAISSTSFELNKLDSFKSWLVDLKSADQIQQYMPFIVSKMLDGDPLAHSIFVEIYKELDKKDLLFSSQTFANHPELKIGISNSDAGVGSRAVINAEHWINSEEGKTILCTGVIYKDDIEKLIGESCEQSSVE